MTLVCTITEMHVVVLQFTVIGKEIDAPNETLKRLLQTGQLLVSI